MKEEIIKLAKEAGMVVYEGDQDRVLFEGSVIDSLTRFFHMAQAAERDRISDAAMKAVDKAIDKSMELEREACAKLAAEYAGCAITRAKISDAIRARGQA